MRFKADYFFSKDAVTRDEIFVLVKSLVSGKKGTVQDQK
jgi:hypothetical protein